MRKDVLQFFQRVLPKYGMSLNYIPKKDLIFVHKRGYGILSITHDIFFQIPKKQREKHFLPLLKRGLHHNCGEQGKDNLFMNRRHGRLMIK